MTSTNCPKCGADMDPKKPCPECGHEINALEHSEDGIKPPKIVEEDPKPNECKDSQGDCPKKIDGKCKDGCKGPKSKMDSVDRIDYWGDLNSSATMSESIETTESGSLVGKAPIFGTGVYRYMGADGKVTAEFRPPEEVFSKETLESYELVPLTNTHPPEKVTPENYKKYAVGNLGEEIERDSFNAYAEMVIHDAEAIAAVKAGRTGLSGGYSCDVVTEGEVSFPVMGWNEDYTAKVEIARTVYKIPGNFNGTPYDAIQTNIRGNHVALVDIPRGGDALHLRFDGADVGMGVRISDNKPISPNQKESQMAKIKLDGAQEHEVPEAVKVHLDSLDAKVASLEAEKSALQAKADSASEELKSVKADAKAKEDGFQAKVDAAVSARVELVATATKHGVKADGSDAEIKGALIAKAFPTAKLDGKDEAYMAARLDAALELLESGIQHVDALESQRGQTNGNRSDSTSKEDSIEAKLGSAYKTPKK